MKSLVLMLALISGSSVYAASHPASVFVNKTLLKGQQILSLKSDSAKVAPFCNLIRGTANTSYISGVLLGRYAQLATDKTGAAQFVKMLPSIIVTRVMPAIGKAEGGSFTVSPDAVERSKGIFVVDITVHAGNGNPYSGKVIVASNGSSYRIIDGEYMGFSAVKYSSRDMQKKLDQAADRKKPITEVLRDMTADPDFIRCP